MADGKSRLTQEEEKVFLQLLQCRSLSLLYKATVHGYNADTFHTICNRQGPTVVVAYNASGYIYGAFTAESYTSRGSYVSDDKAFLFRLKGKEKEPSPLKIPFKYASQAVYNEPLSGPTFGGGGLIFLYRNTPAVSTNLNITNYTFCANDLHGNDNTLSEWEVYRVEGLGAMLENPLRKVEWTAGQREKLMAEIRTFRPSSNSVPKLRVLFLGPVNAGKSSFFNSVNSVFQGYVASNAIAGSDSTSLTMQYRTYEVETGDGKPLSIIFCDTMGLEEKEGAGLNIDELPSLLKGHVPDRYQFNPYAVIQPNTPGYIKSPSLKDQIHCVVLIIDGSKVEILPEKLEEKLRKIRKETKTLEVPLLVIITKVDEVRSTLADDVSDVYKSKAVVEKMQLTAEKLGIPLCQVVPVKNYSSEIDLKNDVDILILMAVRQMLRLAKGYFYNLPSEKENCRLFRRLGRRLTLQQATGSKGEEKAQFTMADGKSRLTQEEEKVFLQLLQCKSLSLLYKATVHGYNPNTFHTICNRQGPTVVVAYNPSGYIYGAFTAESYTSRGSYVSDDKAFLFRLKGKEKEPSPLKIQFKSASQAVYDVSSSGPNFGGGALIFLYQNTSAVSTNPNITNYTFCANDLHGNDNTLSEWEVYRVEGLGAMLENPLRKVEWTTGQREKLMAEIRTFRPSLNSVPKLRVLFLGPVNAGKSSFFNSVNSIFQGYVASDAIAGSDSTSVTMQYRTYEVETGDGKSLSIVFCDTMGLEEKEGTGLNIDELPNLLKGHVPDRYQFNPCAVLHPNASGYIKSPSLKDQIHCVVLIIDGSKVEILPEKLEEKLRKIRKETKTLEVPLLVIITKVDEVCSALVEDVSDVYKSKAVVEKMQLTGEKLGIPLCQVVPVKNYSSEIDLKDDVDILILMAVRQMLRLTKGYFKSLPLAKGN